MIPTLAGIVLITFLLFDVAGGSPAAMVLGKNASAQAMEEFDESKGFNKPVLAGLWTGTRALEDADFSRSAGALSGATGARFMSDHGGGWVRLAPNGACAVPFVFPPRPGTVFSLRFAYRGERPAAWALQNADTPGPLEIPASAEWRTAELIFRTAAAGAPAVLTLRAGAGAFDVRALRLRRRVAHGWDSQLTHYLGQLARLDLGVSTAANRKVTDLLREGIGPSLALTVPIFFGGTLLSIALALVCAYTRNRLPDRLLVLGAVVLMSVNYLVWIIAGQYLLAYKGRWFPIWGFDSWRHLALPVLIGIASGLGANLRFYRTVMLDEMYKDYVRTAFAKGLSPAGVLLKHVLPNALIPILTNTVIAIPFLYTGSLLLESFFGIPGLGGLSVNAINSADVDVVRGVVLVGAVLYMGASLLTDLCYAVVDPRVKLR